jgi:hypothetical protein
VQTTPSLLCQAPAGAAETKQCQQCGKHFERPKDRTNRAWKAQKYCSLPCAYKNTARKPEHGCMECHVAVGIGVNESARLAGKNKGGVSTWRKNHGLKTAIAPRPRWLSLEERTKRAQEEAFVRERCAWARQDSITSWARHPLAIRERQRLAYYRNHEESKQRSRVNARKTWEKHKLSPEWRKKRNAMFRLYRAKNRQKYNEWAKQWRRENPEKWKKCSLKQRSNPVFRAMRNIRKRLRDALRGKRACPAIVGCSRIDFMRHIESKFKKGMHWNNYGTHWHIDHIVPLSRFDLDDPYQLKMANHWTNLQPLEAARNMEKSDRIEGNVQPFLPL